MKNETIKTYLKEKINNWYANTKIDYGTTGKFLDCEVNGNNLSILFVEDGETLKCTICWYTEYSAEQLYNIWMEGDWEEVNIEESNNKPQEKENLKMNNAINQTLKNLGMELLVKDEKDGIIFEIYRLKNCCLECYTYPKNEEHKKKYFACSTRPISYMAMLSYCQYNYK